MYKYLFFIIIGIILYLFSNGVDNFNVGNQYTPCRDTQPQCNDDLICIRNICQNDLLMNKRFFHLLDFKLYQAGLVQWHLNHIFAEQLYMYNTISPTEDVETISLNVFKNKVIYLGYFQKLSETYSVGDRGLWQNRHFFLKCDLEGNFNLVYAEVVMDRNFIQVYESSIVRDSGSVINVSIPVNQSLLIPNSCLRIRKSIKLDKGNLYNDGKRDGSQPDNYVTVFFQTGEDKRDLVIHSDNTTNTPILQLKKILEYFSIQVSGACSVHVE